MSWTYLLAFAQISGGEGFDLIKSFGEAGPMAKVVLTTLALFSIGSWAVMIGKHRQLRKAERQSRDFLRIFHKSSRFSEVGTASERLDASPLVGIFRAGYAEIRSQVQANRTSTGETAGYTIRSLQSVERSLRRALGLELIELNRNTPFLATTAAATPFIGLFGTVWGIMMAFNDIGATGSTSLVAVAPGIAEALINTAAGLIAAIPALIGFNYFAQQIRQSRSQMEDFILEFINLAERNFT